MFSIDSVDSRTINLTCLGKLVEKNPKNRLKLLKLEQDLYVQRVNQRSLNVYLERETVKVGRTTSARIMNLDDEQVKTYK